MSNEEKKAIEVIKKGLAVYYDDYSLLDEEEIEENELVNNSINIVINLIKKQQKEIEELKDTRSVFNMGRRSYKKKNEMENKIKAKIEEYREQIEELKDLNIFTYTEYEGAIKVLQSLLEKE